MDEFPVANLVFIILTIAILSCGLFLAIQVMYPQQHIEKDYEYYKDRQEVANAFHNLAKAYRDCSVEENCMCDIYRVRFPSSYSIKAENQGYDLKLTLIEKGKPWISETITGMATGIMQDKEDTGCWSSEKLEIHAEKKEWYVLEGESLERHYMMSSIEELYKPKQGIACIVPESLILSGNETRESIEDYFSLIPRCTFKQRKKEELALASFKKFVEEYNECAFASSKGVCMCSFSRISLPEGYSIRQVSQEKSNSFVLEYSENGKNAKELLKMEVDAEPLAESSDMPEFRKAEICVSYSKSALELKSACKKGEVLAEKAVFFSNSSKAGFISRETGIIRLEDARQNRASIEPCTMKKGYEFVWPAEKLNGVHYISECFGSGEEGCNKGIEIPAAAGSPVYAAEDGIVEYASESTIRIRHKGGIRTQYENAEPVQGIQVKKQVAKAQQIGKIANGKKSLVYSLTDKSANAELFEDSKICRQYENKAEAMSVFRYGVHYLNPACYFNENTRNSIVCPNKCETPFKGCDAYGNEETPKYEVRLKILVLPVNWERKISYLMYSSEALEKFLKATPLNDCPYRFSRIFVDGKTDYGPHWSSGSCIIENENNCLKDALASIKTCAEEYKARTGEDYDYVVGVEDSDIAGYPECIYADRGWTSDNSDAVIVEANNACDMIHEMGHKFGLKDQYCDCTGTKAENLCGYAAKPNPLKAELGCGDKCCVGSEQLYPYLEECRWCSGNLDINSKDSDGNGMLDTGKRTAMSNFIDSNSYSIDEYLLMKANPQLQCT
ncbi:MAG: M23 family metallopeptidase [Candidatus Nanoarchaeia archaeon]|nr:M23 family metallopeptidase [Candidatus Nanoarchaeia archaeon]